MSNTRSKEHSERFIAIDEDAIAAIEARSMAVSLNLRPHESLLDYVARGSDTVERNIEQIERLLSNSDGFDALELLRIYESPISLDNYRESTNQMLPAAVEIVALVLLGRGRRASTSFSTPTPNPGEQTPELHRLAAEIIQLGQLHLIEEGRSQKHGPLTSLASTYVNHTVSTRVMQFEHISDRHLSELFASAALESILVDSLGFTFEDFLAVRDAIKEFRVQRINEAREAVVKAAEDDPEASSLASVLAAGDPNAPFIQLIVRPGARASYTAEDIAAYVEIPEQQVSKILTFFSVTISKDFDASKEVRKFLTGNGLFRDAALLHDGFGNYITLNVDIGTDCFLRRAEFHIKQRPKLWKQYLKRRTQVSEELALKYLSSLLDQRQYESNLEYFRPDPDVDPALLGPNAADPSLFGAPTETDGLFIADDVAICVEVKGGKISDQARGGGVKRLASDLRETVGKATEQALRLENLIRLNGGLWKADKTWLDLSRVREVRSVAVFLDDMGILATALDQLVRSGILKEDRFPWLVSLHDLAVISEVIDRPAEFLLYLRRRTESDVSLNYSAVDELDLFMLFLQGQLYIEPDPDRVHKEFLGTSRPTNSDRKRYRQNSVPTVVGTHTDALDAWVYHQQGLTRAFAEKPVFQSHPSILKVVDFLTTGHKPGWLRMAADLLNLSDETQLSFLEYVEHVLAMTQSDGKPHWFLSAYAGSWGHPVVAVSTQGVTESLWSAQKRFTRYALTKKHQLKSDRILMLIIGAHAEIAWVGYSSASPAHSPEIDKLGHEMGLEPTPARVPPSARRTTKRLRRR